MSESQLGVAVIGAGMMGSLHAERWNRLPFARVVAVADTMADRAARLAALCMLDRWHTDYREAILHPAVSVVSVCTPTFLHPEIACLAAEHGKHVLCEKPIALSLSEADRMIEAARQNNVRLAVGFMRRYSPVLEDLRRRLAAGELGHPIVYHAMDTRELRPKREMHDARANGGPVIDMGVHLFDEWSYIFRSSPVLVFAQGLKLAAGRPEIGHIRETAWDTATIVVRYASGDIGTFLVTWGLPPGVNPPGSPDRIYGPKGMVEADYERTYQQLRLTRESGACQVVATCERDMYEMEIEAVARFILDGKAAPAPASGEDGKAALRVSLAALRSIETGQPVSLEG